MVHVPLPIQFPPVQRSLPIQSTLPKIFKASVGGGAPTRRGGRGKEESAAGEQPAEGGEQRTGRGGDGCFGISNIPYLFSINKFNYLYLMHLITCFGPFWLKKKKKFQSMPINIKRFH